ncbi:MAG: hypothetical protein IKI67_04040, partial [Bacteroidales bacterium]|nr:hypothetical protein [Bacteroidales bacterium]
TESTDPGYNYFDDEYTLMMIPSLTSGSAPLPNTAVVEIKLEGVTDPILANISQHEWLAGHSLTYIIDGTGTTPGYTYVMDAVDPTLNYQGGTSTNGKITSYKYPTAGGDVESAREAVGWTIEGYYPDATSAATKDVSKRYRNGVNATFINSFTPTTGSGSATGEAVSVVYPPSTPNTPVVDNPGAAYDAAIAAKAKVGTTTPYNLAGYKPSDGTTNENTTQINNTANTYIINGPGYYRFPVVMGNGIKNGSVNSVAYSQSGFTDYLNRAITSPYLNGTGDEQPTSVVLAWADWNFIEVVDPSSPTNGQPYANIETWYLKNEGSPSTQTITNGISKIGEYYWVNFHVPTATKQGIASISVRDAQNRTMWTWLIWLTDYKLGTGDIECKSLLNTLNASSGTITVNLMPRNLGYVERWSETVTEYPADTPAYIRLEQSESGNSKVVAISRSAYTDKKYTRGYGPYYQWGRHVPLKYAATSIDNTDPYTAGFYRHQQTSQVYSGPATMGGSIQQGVSHIASNSQYYLTTRVSSSLWNAGCSTEYNYGTGTDEKVVKTIYDPCPIGYTIPRRNAFTFTYIGYLHEYSTGQYITEVSNTNSPEGTYSGFRGRTKFYTAWRANASAAPSATTIDIPTLGIRMNSSGALNHYSYTYVATAGGLAWHYSRDGFCLFLGSGMIVPANMHNIAYGISVRPAKEE